LSKEKPAILAGFKWIGWWGLDHQPRHRAASSICARHHQPRPKALAALLKSVGVCMRIRKAQRMSAVKSPSIFLLLAIPDHFLR
jgi:hypothetical protein